MTYLKNMRVRHAVAGVTACVGVAAAVTVVASLRDDEPWTPQATVPGTALSTSEDGCTPGLEFLFPTPVPGRDPATNPGVPSRDWRTFPIASGEVDLPPGFRIIETVSAPVEGGTQWSGHVVGIQAPDGPALASTLAWEKETGRITREFIARECVPAFAEIRRQVAAAYGLDNLSYLPGVPAGNQYPGAR